jgi:rod shape-determining protein MreC
MILLSRSSKTHEAFFALQLNEATGKINSQLNNFSGYFNLREANRQLALENAALKNQLNQNFNLPNNSVLFAADSTIKDTNNLVRKYKYLPALVVKNSFTSQENYITIERGSNAGVAKNMSVVSALGVVGKIVTVSENYSIAMSLLNRKSIVTARLKNKEYAGTVEWDGKSPEFLIMKNVSKSAQVKLGDSVLTGNYSANYPSQLLIGTIGSIKNDEASNTYILKLKTATNFYTLQHVNIVANAYFTQQDTLERSRTIVNIGNE